MIHTHERVCPKTGKRFLTPVTGASNWFLLAAGLGSILWILLRVVPKPSRATYPCQRVAVTTALGFAAWLFGAGILGALHRQVTRRISKATLVTTLVGGAVVLYFGGWLLFAQPASTANAAYATWTPTEGPNAPKGQARGIKPGRVVWAYDPLATLWDGKTGHWWDPASADQGRVDAMLSKSLQSLTNTTTDAAAWSVLFDSFNQRRGRTGGYAVGQKIVIKINQNTARGGHAQDGLTNGDQNPINGDPHVILALLKQLVNQGGVAQDDITVYDISRYIGDAIFVPCHAAFGGVHFLELDSGGGDGREAFDGQWVQNALTFAGQGVGRNLPKFIVNASYMINLASLKAHGDDAGPTLHAKNHYGTITGLNHTWPNAANSYSFFVELMGSKYLGENTFLFLIDGLFGAPGADASPARFASYPFGGNWPSSLILSQDGVANESVGWDFINAEWGVPVGCDNTLHEAANANAPGSGTTYAPNGDGIRLPSLGVHEHWNNAIDKKYSRNLGTGDGIELVQLFAADAPIAVLRSGWTATASNQGEVPANAIDGKLNTRWTTGNTRAANQWFQVDMGSTQTFSELVLDANGSTDYIGGYQVLVSNDATNWGSAVAQGTATGPKTVITFPMQTARFFKIIATDAGTHWWSIYELNAYTTAGNGTPGTGTGGTASTGGAPSVNAGGAPNANSGGRANSLTTSMAASGATNASTSTVAASIGGTPSTYTATVAANIGGIASTNSGTVAANIGGIAGTNSGTLAATGGTATSGNSGSIASLPGATTAGGFDDSNTISGNNEAGRSSTAASAEVSTGKANEGCNCRMAPHRTKSPWVAWLTVAAIVAALRRKHRHS